MMRHNSYFSILIQIIIQQLYGFFSVTPYLLSFENILDGIALLVLDSNASFA